MNEGQPVCHKCRHFYVTWDRTFPRGCRALQFKCREIPSQVVLEASGKPCLQFEAKPPRKAPGEGGSRSG